MTSGLVWWESARKTSRVRGQAVRSEVGRGEFDLRVGIVDTVVTITTQVNTTRQLISAITLPIARPSVNLSRYQVVKGQRQFAAAEGTEASQAVPRAVCDCHGRHIIVYGSNGHCGSGLLPSFF